MGCGTTLVKYSVFIFNLIFVLAGIALIAVGVVFKLGLDNVTEPLGDIASFISLIPTLIIVLGCIVFVIAFMGCCGALRESICMLSTYGVIMLILFLLQIGLGTYAYVSYKNASKSLENDISKALTSAIDKVVNGNVEAMKGIDYIQEQFKCCGAQGTADWTSRGKDIPSSCCRDKNCILSPYQRGCVTLVFDEVQNIVTIIVAVVYTIAGIELASAIVAFCLMSCIRNNIRRGYY